MAISSTVCGVSDLLRVGSAAPMLSQIAALVAPPTVIVVAHPVRHIADATANIIRIVSVLLSRITQRVIARVPALLGDKAQK
jgi:hypothetical protein